MTILLDEDLAGPLTDNAEMWDQFADLLTPPERVHPMAWIERNVFLPRTVSPMPGRVRIYPYQREPLDAMFDPTVREVVLCWGTQLGKSAIWQWLIPYYARTNPVPVMVVTPDRESAKKLSRLRIYPIITACHATRPLLPARHEQDTFLVNLLNCYVRFGWSGSVASLGSESIFFLIFTELDKMTRDKTQEGDPEDLAMNRVKAYANHKVIKEGTPTREDTSRIWSNLERSDMRKYHVPCPHCGEFQELIWGIADPGSPGVKWSKGPDGHSEPIIASATAYYECAHCHKDIHEESKPGMLTRGKWVSRTQTIDKSGRIRGTAPNVRRAGFHLSSLYSLQVTWGEMAATFLEKLRHGREGLQDFWNAWLCLPWRDPGESPEWETVSTRLRGNRPAGTVPKEAVFLTAAIDCHEYHQNYIVRAWGRNNTSWLIDFGTCETLAQTIPLVVEAEYEQEENEQPVQAARIAIDAGWRPDQTYAFTRKVGPRAIAVRGQGTWRAPWSMSNIEVDPRTKKPYPGGQRLYHVHVTHYKPEIYYLLKEGPLAGEAGAFNLNTSINEEYLRQLCGETRVKKYDRRNHEYEEWVVTDKGVGNHYLDCEVYAWAAADISGRRQLTGSPTSPRPPRRTRTARKKTWLSKTEGWI